MVSFLGFWSSSPKKKAGNDDDDDDLPHTQQQQQPLTPHDPSHSSVERLRSLFRTAAWNALPPLPTHDHVQLDVVDFFCHAVILEPDRDQNALYQRYLEAALCVLPGTLPVNSQTEARLLVAGRARERVNWQWGHIKSPPNETGTVSVYNFKPDDWKRIGGNWNEMREAVVRAAALNQHDDNDLLNGDFRAVQRLLQYQYILTLFRESLQNDNPTSIEESIQLLENGWNGKDLNEKELNNKNNDEEEEEDEHSVAPPEPILLPSPIRHILEPLKKRRPNIKYCMQRFQDLMWDDSNEFSHAFLQHAVRMDNCLSLLNTGMYLITHPHSFLLYFRCKH